MLKYLLLFQVLLLTSCVLNDVRIIEEKAIIGSWSYDTIIVFEEVSIESAEHLYLVVNHEEVYGYENLYLAIATYKEKELIKEYILSIQLMDDQGAWLGRSKNNLRSLDYSLSPKLLTDKYSKDLRIEIRQYSRQESLDGIKSLILIAKDEE